MGRKGGKYKRKENSGLVKNNSVQLDSDDEDTMNDEIDACMFHKNRDVVQLNIIDDMEESDEDNEQPVLDFEDEDEEDDEDEPPKGLAAKIVRSQKCLRAIFGGVEDELLDDADEEDQERVVWGKKRDMYGADELQSSDDEDAAEEEAEVKILQSTKTKLLSNEDFGLEDASQDEADREPTFEEILDHGKPPTKASLDKGIKDEYGITYEIVKKDLNALTKEEQMDTVYSSAPELIGLLSKLNDAFEQLQNKVNPLIDKVAPRNTIGNVPLEWYKDEEHIGYDLAGKKIKKRKRQSKVDYFLASVDDPKDWRKIYDEYNDEVVELTKEETKLIGRVLKGKAPHADFDPCAPYVDWFVWDGAKHPLSNAPEPKRRFIPSKWESKMVLRYVRAIRSGAIKLDDKPKEEPQLYPLWDDKISAERQGLAYIPAPKPKLPGHEESYNPSLEYIPTQEEINSYQLMFEEDRPKFIPKQFTSLRSVPAYEKAVQETFDRCLDLYLCPRVRKKRINIDPESLKPKLPSRKDLKPYPTTCYLEYRGHTGPLTTISTEPTGQWIASGSKDGTVRIWEVETGRCLQIWDLGENIAEVAWNPLPELSMLAVAAGQDVFILNTRCGSDEQLKKIEDLLHVEPQKAKEESDISASIVNWGQDDRHGGIRLRHFKTVTKVEWHRKGDYLSTLMPSGESRSVMIHQLSKRLTQRIPFKTKG